MKKSFFKLIIVAFLLIMFSTALFFIGKNSNLVFGIRAEPDFNYLKIYNARNFKLKNQIPLFKDSIGYSIATLDLGGDGQDEILVGSGPGDRPWVKIMRGDGSMINEFLAYNENFLGGVEVAGCDLDGDGKDEILTGVRSNGGPHLRVFDSYGNIKLTPGFFAYNKNLDTGVQITCADINGDKIDEIVTVGGKKDKKQLKIFDPYGNLQKEIDLEFKGKNIKVSKIDLGGDGIEEILVAGGWHDQPKAQIYRADLSLINEFLVYAKNFSGGINVAGADVDKDGKGEIITTPGLLGGPHLRIFDSYGQEKMTYKTFIFDNNFRGGLSLAVGDVDGDGQSEIIVAPQNLPTGRTDLYKYIDIDVGEQRFRYYQQGFLLGDFITSTGKPSTPTRLGEFKVISKYQMAYGSADGVRWAMPYFIGFYTAGSVENGIHELPFLNGYREGESSLGHAVSHGCVRLPIGPAKEVYDWAEIGVTKIFVHK